MLTGITLGAIAVAAVLQGDTVFTVDPNLRIELANRSGEIIVRTWDRDEISVRTDYWYRGGPPIEFTSSSVRIGSRWRHWDDEDIDYVLTVPATMALELRGQETDVSVDGARGEVMVEVGEGDVTIRGGSGRVSVQTDDGEIRVEEATGRIRLFSMDGDITLEHAAGDIEVDATDGMIELYDVEATNLVANTVDGDIRFDGGIAPQGSYVLSTHDGDITVYLPEDTDARVRAALHDGDFSSDFAVTLPAWPPGRRVEFTLGAGRADLQIETFDGDIVLRRGR